MITSRCFHLVCVNSTSTGHVGRPNLGIFSHLRRVDLSWTNLFSMQLVQKHGQLGSARCSNYTHPICKMIFSYLSDLQYNRQNLHWTIGVGYWNPQKIQYLIWGSIERKLKDRHGLCPKNMNLTIWINQNTLSFTLHSNPNRTSLETQLSTRIADLTTNRKYVHLFTQQ